MNKKGLILKDNILTTIIFFVFIFGLTNTAFSNEQYYGFYESNKGSEYKEFRHNIFGFSIDIPMDELDLLFWSSQTGFIFK